MWLDYRKTHGMGAGRKLKSHRRRQRWADKSYKKSNLGNEWKKPFAGSSLHGPALGFGLPKPVTILVIHLLLNIKKHHKRPKNFFIQNKCYIMFLAWITLKKKKTIKTKNNFSYSNYMSNSFLTKKFLIIN
jgi:hypothetical protein